MGKKSCKNSPPSVPRKSETNSSNIKYLPFVSVCTVTFNRRPFWPIALELFRNQTYPKNRMEWVIVDDGTDKIQDLIEAANIPQIKYISIANKMTLGAKRNLSHTYCKGSIIVYNDDDDFYPPERVSHAVERLMAHPEALCAGSSELYLYFKHINTMYQCGPYSPTHSTAGTFAFWRELLNQTRYDDSAALAEEKFFLKNYTIPFVQLDPMKTILVFSHTHNTFDKKKLLEHPHPQFLKPSLDKTVDSFIKGPGAAAIKKFFMEDIDAALAKYEPGDPKYKPDAMEYIKNIEIERDIMLKKANNGVLLKNAPAQVDPIVIQIPNEDPKILTQEEVVGIMRRQNEHIQHLTRELAECKLNQICQKCNTVSPNVNIISTPIEYL
jgi:glycosyltransferase involved in cell wall biosynthesis